MDRSNPSNGTDVGLGVTCGKETLVGACVAVDMSGTLDVNATHTAKTTTEIDGSAAGGVAIGAAIGLTVAVDAVDAGLAGKVVNDGAVNIIASSTTDSSTTAKAAAQGAEKDENKTEEENTANAQVEGPRTKFTEDVDVGDAPETPSAETDSGNTVSVGAAVAANIAISTTGASMTGELSGPTPVPFGHATQAGPLTIRSLTDADAEATADASAKTDGAVGVGVAAALNVAVVTNEAFIDGSANTNASIYTTGAVVEALMNDSDDGTNTFKATAESGAVLMIRMGSPAIVPHDCCTL